MTAADERYISAAELLPPGLSDAALRLPPGLQHMAEEFRLRCGRPLTVLVSGTERALPGRTEAVESSELYSVLDRATQMSAYSAAEQLREGFVIAEGGFRVGLCGCAVVREGRITSMRDLSSVSIRISRERKGAAAPIADELWENGRFCSTLLIAPPGLGKTTLLRDIIRMASDGFGSNAPMRVAAADERGEIGAVWRGRAQMDIGEHTDIMTACPKAEGVMMLLRAMNPELIAVDEVTAERDVEAMLTAANCGAAIIASAHGESVASLDKRPLYRKLLAAGIFSRFVTISARSGERKYKVERT